MIVNEIAQWAALVFIGVFVVGLTRQLGKFLVSPRDQLVAENGPAVGKSVGERILGGGGVEQLAQLMRQRRSGWAAILVVGEGCVGCGPLLDRMEADGAPDNVPVVIATRSASAEYRERLERLADIVTVDARAIQDLRLRATPFALLVDDDLTLLYKEMAWDLGSLTKRWRNQDSEPDGNRRTEPPVLSTTQVGGGQ